MPDRIAGRRIDDEVDRFLARSPRPALCGAVLDGDGRFDFARGPADAVHAAAPPVFEIGSIGKTFTAALLALLVREGAVALDDPVARYRPQYPFAAQVTLRHLASHSSGLPANPASTFTMLRGARAFAEAHEADDLEAFLRAQPARPRSFGRFGYSNVGMALLGHLLAGCLGTTYARAVTGRVLAPLGMDDTRAAADGYGPRLLPGHDARGRPVPPIRWRGMEPAGTWFSTVPDMVRFLRAQLGLEDPAWAALARSMAEPVVRVRSDTDVGLGWMLSPVAGAGRVAWHSGGTFGQHAIVQWAPERRRAVVILSNRRPPLWHHFAASRRLEDLADRLITAPAPSASDPGPVPA